MVTLSKSKHMNAAFGKSLISVINKFAEISSKAGDY